jgi:hypothetical protein
MKFHQKSKKNISKKYFNLLSIITYSSKLTNIDQEIVDGQYCV